MLKPRVLVHLEIVGEELDPSLWHIRLDYKDPEDYGGRVMALLVHCSDLNRESQIGFWSYPRESQRYRVKLDPRWEGDVSHIGCKEDQGI